MGYPDFMKEDELQSLISRMEAYSRTIKPFRLRTRRERTYHAILSGGGTRIMPKISGGPFVEAYDDILEWIEELKSIQTADAILHSGNRSASK
jgi:hypothetical protein